MSNYQDLINKIKSASGCTDEQIGKAIASRGTSMISRLTLRPLAREMEQRFAAEDAAEVALSAPVPVPATKATKATKASNPVAAGVTAAASTAASTVR